MTDTSDIPDWAGEEACDHDYQRGPYSGTTLEYECAKCGDSYERDVS